MKELSSDQRGGAYCPSCKYYGYDCNVDEEEWTLPCDAYEPRGKANADT